MGNHQTRIVLADDHVKVRAGMRKLLESQPDLVVIGEAGNGLEAIELIDKLSPDILLLDMEMPLKNGGEVAAYVKENGLNVKILAVSAYDDWHYIRGMLDSGAAGYLIKEEVPEILIKAVRGVASGESGWMSKKMASRVFSYKAKSAGDGNKQVVTD